MTIRETTFRETSFREKTIRESNHPGNDCKPQIQLHNNKYIFLYIIIMRICVPYFFQVIRYILYKIRVRIKLGIGPIWLRSCLLSSVGERVTVSRTCNASACGVSAFSCSIDYRRCRPIRMPSRNRCSASPSQETSRHDGPVGKHATLRSPHPTVDNFSQLAGCRLRCKTPHSFQRPRL